MAMEAGFLDHGGWIERVGRIEIARAYVRFISITTGNLIRRSKWYLVISFSKRKV